MRDDYYFKIGYFLHFGVTVRLVEEAYIFVISALKGYSELTKRKTLNVNAKVYNPGTNAIAIIRTPVFVNRRSVILREMSSLCDIEYKGMIVHIILENKKPTVITFPFVK